MNGPENDSMDFYDQLADASPAGLPGSLAEFYDRMDKAGPDPSPEMRAAMQEFYDHNLGQHPGFPENDHQEHGQREAEFRAIDRENRQAQVRHGELVNSAIVEHTRQLDRMIRYLLKNRY